MPSRPHAAPARPRWWHFALPAALILALAASLLVAWGGAGLLLTPHHSMRTSAGVVQSATATEVVLQRRASTLRVGTYGLEWSGGRAVIGPITRTTKTTVTRPLSDAHGTTLRAGTAVDIDPDVWPGNPTSALGIPFTNVEVPDPLGPMPAWQVAGNGTTWVLFVHGIDGQRQGGLRPLQTIAKAGLPTLLITYRNDVGAPPSPNGLIHLGTTEWHDLDAAARYAVGQGAEHFILYGDSMGGSIVTQFIHHSSYASRVTAMVLDAPVLDWSGVLQNQAERLHMGVVGPMLQTVVSLRGGIDLASLNQLDQTSVFTMPILLFQGLADPLVPPAESKQFADAVGAEYVPVAHAGHIQSWNVDPTRYADALSAFLGRVTG